jgi:hypothetical protein
VLRLEVSANEPVAMVAARLSDVAPDGRATRVTYGMLNLTHRDSHSTPEPLEPGERYPVELALNCVAQNFPPGHRIRLSLSTSYWPLAWPPPEPVRLSVHTRGSTLELPVRPTAVSDEITLRPFDEPEGTRPLTTTRLTAAEYRWDVTRDLIDYRSALDIVKDGGTLRFEDTGMEIGKRVLERYGSTADDFGSVHGETTWTMTFGRRDWAVRVVTFQELTCTPTEFRLHARLDAFEGKRRVASRNWEYAFPRDLV